jgi:hypothetical protein
MLQLASIFIIHEYVIAGLKKILLFSLNCSQIWLNPLHRNGLRAVVLLAPTAKTNSSGHFPRAFAVLLQRNSVTVAHSLVSRRFLAQSYSSRCEPELSYRMYGHRSRLQLRGRIEEGLCLNFSHYFFFLAVLARQSSFGRVIDY